MRYSATRLVGTPELSIGFTEAVSPETASTMRNLFLRLYYTRKRLYSLLIKTEKRGLKRLCRRHNFVLCTNTLVANRIKFFEIKATCGVLDQISPNKG